MARLGQIWGNNLWDTNIWDVDIWAQVPATPPGTVAETGQMRRHFNGWAGERRR